MKPEPEHGTLTFVGFSLTTAGCHTGRAVGPVPVHDGPSRAQTVDTEIARHCAFSLPGVALTMGRKNWPCLKEVYETLASDMQVKLQI